MLTLDQVQYSEEATVTAVTDFFIFLTKMYLPDSAVVHPPPGGWPTLASDLRNLGKSDTVLSLLSHLPYINEDGVDENKIPEVTPSGRWADWHTFGIEARERNGDLEQYRVITEEPTIMEHVPAHVVGLSASEHDTFLLDTELGVVYWYECDGRLRYGPRTIEDDPYEYCDDDEEAEWRADGAAWPVADFFEVLKKEFRTLRWMPWNEYDECITVMEAESSSRHQRNPVPAIQAVYRRHGWPHGPEYRKEACLEETKAVALAIERGEQHEGEGGNAEAVAEGI
jgi:hypothetical protein